MPYIRRDPQLRFFNLPNVLTLFRFLLIPVFLYVYFSGHAKWALLVVLLAGLTDVLDGYIARRRGQTTEIGSMLDPLADKSMMLTVFLSLLYTGTIPWPAALAMVFRDAGMIVFSAVFHFRGKKTVPANFMGKLTTVLFYLAILLLVFEADYAVAFLWGVIALSFVTSFRYLIFFRRLNREEERESGGESAGAADASGELSNRP